MTTYIKQTFTDVSMQTHMELKGVAQDRQYEMESSGRFMTSQGLGNTL